MLSIDPSSCPVVLRAGLTALIDANPARLRAAADATVVFTPGFTDAPGWAATCADGVTTIRYARPIDAFRALGHLLGGGAGCGETAAMTMTGIMVDVSRNGVLTVPAAEELLRYCALLGINMVMLYSEDTYEVPGEPFFGYLRGRYTQAELKALDDYADALGIEMVPCIQTLGHLEQILQWPAFAEYVDTAGILLAGEEQTYALLRRMITAAAAPFRSTRIHLGMDEAYGVGQGKYKEKHGEVNPFDILNAHLARVREICQELGLRPMIWSDMYFSLAARGYGGYYATDFTVPQEVIDQIPSGVELVYWDYYHTQASDYTRKIDQHRMLKSEPLVAGGGWTWNRLVAALPYAFAATDACMTACKEKGIREAFTTLWGDDGMECDVFSSLPAIALFAEHAYHATVDRAHLAAQFRGACDADLADFWTAAKIDYLAEQHDGTKGPDNMSKWLLWEDPLLPVADPQIAEADLRLYYQTLAAQLTAAADKGGLSARLRTFAAIAAAIAGKVNLRRELAAAYQAGDRARLRALRDHEVANARAAMDTAWRTYRAMWLSTYKPFGLEVIELRFGGQRTRLESLWDRLGLYLDGHLADIPELAEPLLRYTDAPLKDYSPDRGRVQTPSMIK